MTIAGPIHREHFFAAQRRHRRAARLLTALAFVAVVLVSVPLAAVVFPLIFGVVALLSMLVGALTGSASLLDALMATGGHFAEGDNALLEAMAYGLVIVLPGALVMLALWRRCLRLLGSLEPARLVELFGARLAHGNDLEERQVTNILEELALAAGIPAPVVRIVENDTVNAAAIAPRADGALVLVTRGLLEAANRAETQALLGSVVGSIANGDARAAFRWMGVAAAFNLAADLLHAPLSQHARTRLAVLVPALRSGSIAGADGNSSADAARVIELLLGAPPANVEAPQGRVRIALVFPFMFASAMFNMVGFLANLLFLSPALTVLMRRRRHLADATAVQLTRDPDSLARGLALTVNRAAAQGWPLARFAPAFLVAPTQIDNAPLGQQFGTHPSVAARHARAIRMGADANLAGEARSPLQGLSGWRAWVVAALSLVAAGLMLVLVPLMLYAMLMVTLLALMVGMMYVMLVLLPLRWLLGLA